MAEQGNTDELAHVYDSVPYEESGLYDDPSPLLDNYEKQTTTVVRPMEISDIEEALEDGMQTLRPDQQEDTFRRFQTFREEGDQYITMRRRLSFCDDDDSIDDDDEWETESEEVLTGDGESDEDITRPPVIMQLDNEESMSIPILGSLMLKRESSVIEKQGIFQGLVVDEKERQRMGILPVALYMTQTLERFGSELEDMSVRVTRETDIVPTSPFDFSAPPTCENTDQASKREPSTARRRSQQKCNISISMKYASNIVRPPPLPPLGDSQTTAERKKYQVMFQLLQSEAGFLTSLKIAIEVYMKPLKELAAGSSPILDTGQVVKLFGPVEHLLQIHELFYIALGMRTKEWSPQSQIGDVFLSSFNRREITRYYPDYINNFTSSMSILERGINKKQRLVDFLQHQLENSPSQLSLQALLLKPIQRFPQYILFLKDLIKYTSPDHTDYVILQMAQASIEEIAEFLNEAKKQAEQIAIVHYLSSRIDKLPFRLKETQQVLLRQDSVTWLKTLNNGIPTYRQRQLLLFNDMVICSAKKESRMSWIVSTESTANDIRLEHKWHCQLSLLTVSNPDYEKQSVPYLHSNVEEKEAVKTTFQTLKEDIKQLDEDFHTLTKIVPYAFSLNKEYTGVTLSNVQTDIRVLQRQLNTKRKQLESCEPGRLDLVTASKADKSGTLIHHTILFESEKTKQEWLRILHFAKLKQSQTSTLKWIYEEEEEEEEVDDDVPNFGNTGSRSLSTIHHFPLFVDCFKLAANSYAVECATCVGSKTVWVATGSTQVAQIIVIRCLSPTPILIETFPVASKKITCMLATPSNTPYPESSNPPLVVWIGTSIGRLLLYSAETKKCLKFTYMPHAITCIQKYKNRVFVGTKGGSIVVFTQLRGNDWDLENKRTIPASDSAIECLCTAEKKLWIGSGQSCLIMSMGSLRLQASIRVTKEAGVTVTTLSSTGAGVWVALSKGGTMYLYHRDTRQSLQEINIRGSLENILNCANLQDKVTSLNKLTVTAVLASTGNLWVGTSVGAILVYKIPHLNGLPITNGKPILASDGHNSPVRFLLRIRTKLDISTARVDQFISDEKRMQSHSPLIQSTPQSRAPPPHKVNLKPINRLRDRASPIPIDVSKPPPVSQIIKNLEEQKSCAVQPAGHYLHYSSLPTSKPSEQEGSAENSQKKGRKAEQEEGGEQSQQKGEGNPEQDQQQEEEGKTTEQEEGGGGYEDARILDEYPQNPQSELTADDVSRVYDEVPTENITDELEVDETVCSRRDTITEVDETARSRRDTVIEPMRYEVSLNASHGSVFTLLNEDPLEHSARIRVTNEQVEGSVFVFAGGTGHANFSNEEIPRSQTLLHRLQNAGPTRSTMENLPCVLAYQIQTV